jgi:large subunit ribosomal protein L25
VPGVLYGGGDDAMPFAVDERELRHALAARGAVVELELGGEATPAVLKDAQRHPVRGHTMHVDFLRVNLNVAIHSVVALELVGGDDAPGAIEGGVLEHVTREVNIEALPNDIPERLQVDVSSMQINDTLTLSAVTAPDGVTILDDLDETVVATLTPPKLQADLEALDEEAALEQETELVGEGEAPAADEGDAGAGDSGGGDAADESSE